MKHLRVDVCVLGTGPAGLALAGLLARSGIDTLAVSRATGLAEAPRMQRVDAGAMAVLRDQGLHRKLGRLAQANAAGAGALDVSQHMLTALQLNEALRLGAEVKFGIEVLDVRQDGQAAYAQLHNRADDEDYEVIADYLVGADDAWPSSSQHYPDRHQGRLFRTDGGVVDAYTLAWRLALVVKGQAAPRLLDAYDAEPGKVLAGEQVPVVTLQMGRVQTCSVDLVGKGCFTVLTGPGGDCWRHAASAQADALGIEIGVVGIGHGQEVEDPTGAWAAQSGIGADGCLLVRPDGGIALCVAGHSPIANELLGATLRRHLGREH